MPAAAPLVALKVPLIVDAPRSNAVVPLSINTLPAVPLVVSNTAPVEARVSSVIVLSATSVVTVVVPVTLNAALSVIASPLVSARSPDTVPCTPNAVVPLSIVTWPAVPLVVSDTAPVSALAVLDSVIAWSAVEVVKLEARSASTAPV